MFCLLVSDTHIWLFFVYSCQLWSRSME